jgi:hypothetical protein
MKKILIALAILDYPVYYRAQVKHHNQVQKRQLSQGLTELKLITQDHRQEVEFWKLSSIWETMGELEPMKTQRLAMTLLLMGKP